ncbi:hypothetical protein [Tichowtungia aerotolerans]|uniref:Uncharacterized protein n=1 Tax=Tichowtungia aerotolerans TaxID=2697043 RepID=A0A6P1M4Z8_9BACT|nr:hypothetical protein [Tichowtungia aerotolerans]QHI69869.1 hypothetical protein GT409_10530 [Tichowtungia aerotolerans]
MTTSWILDGQTAGSVPASGGAELLVDLKLNSSGGSPFLMGQSTYVGCGLFKPAVVSDPQSCWASDAFTAPSDGVYEFVVEGADLQQIVTTLFVPTDPFGCGVMINDTFIYYSSAPGTSDAGDPIATQFCIQLELSQGDTCKIVSLTRWILFHNPHPVYTDVHAGPADSKIRIYKCAIS